MAQTCRYFVCHSSDFRFQSTVEKLLKENGITEFNRLSITGSITNPVFQKELRFSKENFETDIAILMVHEDCKGKADVIDLFRATNEAKEYGFEVRSFSLSLDGTWQEFFLDK